MLTIHDRFPIKKMTLYGSAAFIIGFSGTLAMLYQYVPKDESGNISVVRPSSKQEKAGSVSNQVPKEENQEEAPDPAAPLTQSTPVASGGTLPTRQSSPSAITSTSSGISSNGTMTVAPAPTVNSTPTSSTTSSGGGGTTASEPAPVTASPAPLITNPLPSTSDLQTTVNSVTGETKLVP